MRNLLVQKILVAVVSGILLVVAGRLSAPAKVPREVASQLAREKERADSLAAVLRGQLEAAAARRAEADRQAQEAIRVAQARAQEAQDRAQTAETQARSLARAQAGSAEAAAVMDAAIDSLVAANQDQLEAAHEETRQVRAQLFATTAELEAARQALDAAETSRIQADLAAAVAGANAGSGWRDHLDTGLKIAGAFGLGYATAKLVG